MSKKKTPKTEKQIPLLEEEDIYEILDKAYESEDEDEIRELVDRLLAISPDNPEALVLKADVIEDDDEERLLLRERARGKTEEYFQTEGISGEDIMSDDMGIVYLAILQRMAYTLFTLEEDDRSLEVIEEMMRYDEADQTLIKTLYYRIYLEREDWTHVLEETMKDTNRELGWAYARMIATFMLSAGGKDDGKGKKNKKGGNLEKVDKMLWDAVRLAPNAPFYMLGYTPDPVEDTEEEVDVFHFGILYEGVWAVSRDLLNWFSKGTILFGLLTGRFGEESDDMKEILDALGGIGDYEELTRILADSSEDDDAVLRTLAGGVYPSAY
jgi:tetratricopeptide (TPR) repeat protein